MLARERMAPVLATGTEIGGYRIEDVLGRGGMGVVYRATQLSLGRTVALKLLASELSADDDFRDRFRREARMQARIEHPHIVTVYEAGEVDEGLFIAMRLIQGHNLKQLIRAREVPAARATRILAAVAAALDTAHEDGLIHRDIKPQNILVDRRDHAFLADFGLTKGPGDTGFTRTGQLMGTLDYVSPEQIRGEPASAASDVYALAAVAYECLAGAPPFARATEAAVLYAHVAEPPPRPSEVRPDLGEGLDDVIARGLAKQPAERFARAADLVAAMTAALEGGGGTSTQAAAMPPAAPVDMAPVPTEPVTAPTRPAEDVGDSTDLIDRTPAPDAPPEVTEPVVEAPPVATPSGMVSEATDVGIGSPTITDRRRPVPADEDEAAAEAAPRARSWRRAAPAVAVAAGVMAAAAGYLAGDATEAERPAAVPRTVAAEDLSVRVPAGWKDAEMPEVPGLSLVRGDAVAPAAGGGAIAFGVSDGTGATLLPQTLREEIGADPKPAARVRLGDLEAYRYDGLTPAGPEEAVTVFASPATSGVITVACVGVSGSDCNRVAATLTADDSLRPLPLGPSAAYAEAVGPTLQRLGRDRARAQRELARARRPTSQATAAADVQKAYVAAAGALSRVDPTPLEREAHPRLVGALERAGAAYGRLAGAARAKSRSRYTDARTDARRSDDAAEAAVGALGRLGYEVA